MTAAYVLSNGQRVTPVFVLNSADGGGLVSIPDSFVLPSGQRVAGVVMVDEDGAIAPAPASAADVMGQARYTNGWEPIDSRFFPAVAAGNANAIYLSRFRPLIDMTLAGLTIAVGTASGDVMVGIITESGGTYTPVAVSATTAVAGTSALQSLTFTASYAVTAGEDYYWFLAPSVNTSTFLRQTTLGASSASGLKSLTKANFLPTGAAFTTPSGATQTFWCRLDEA